MAVKQEPVAAFGIDIYVMQFEEGCDRGAFETSTNRDTPELTPADHSVSRRVRFTTSYPNA